MNTCICIQWYATVCDGMQPTDAMGCNGIQWYATAYNRLWYFYNVTFLQRDIFATNLSSEKILLTNQSLLNNARARSIIICYLNKNDLSLAISGESTHKDCTS